DLSARYQRRDRRAHLPDLLVNQRSGEPGSGQGVLRGGALERECGQLTVRSWSVRSCSVNSEPRTEKLRNLKMAVTRTVLPRKGLVQPQHGLTGYEADQDA